MCTCRSLRSLHLKVDSADIQKRTFEGREHLVFPVVMLVAENVIHPVDSETSEYVPLSALTSSDLRTFNNKPITPFHPQVKGEYVSACSPEVAEFSRIGQIFRTRLEGNNLLCDAWIDLDRVDVLGGDAQEALDRINKKQTIDVSVGVFFESEVCQGEFNGKAYGAKWLQIWGDHLALLPTSEGACNQDMGCGAPRAAQANATSIPWRKLPNPWRLPEVVNRPTIQPANLDVASQHVWRKLPDPWRLNEKKG